MFFAALYSIRQSLERGSMMRKLKHSALFLAVLMALTIFACHTSTAEDTACTVTLVYQFEAYPDDILEVRAGSLLGAATNQAFASLEKCPYGYSFVTWYYDAECTEQFDRRSKVEADITLYGKWEPWSAETQTLMDAFFEEMALGKDIIQCPPLYSSETFMPYFELVFNNCFVGFEQSRNLAGITWDLVEQLKAAREALVVVAEKDDVRWDIWVDDVPTEEAAASYSFYLQQDNPDFRPMLAVYLQDDQENAKGNIIICSGGGRTMRCNNTEAYPTVEHMFALGYNCFVLQYRLTPYVAVDSYLDLQRAIRYIKYFAEEKGIGAIENIATIGFSAGGGVISGQIAQCYGDVLPSDFYPEYECDEIDYVNSDVKVAAPIYGLGSSGIIETENPNIPALFLAVGSTDGMLEGYVQGYLAVRSLAPTELHVYEGVPHGFGMGDFYRGANQIDTQFDAFLRVHFGLAGRAIQ